MRVRSAVPALCHRNQNRPTTGVSGELAGRFVAAIVASGTLLVFRKRRGPGQALVTYNLHLLTGAWFIIAVTLGILVAWAVFGGGRITYHRIVGAILLYLLTAVTFATLSAFVGLSVPEAFKGIVFDDDFYTCKLTFLFELCHSDFDRLRGCRLAVPKGTLAEFDATSPRLDVGAEA